MVEPPPLNARAQTFAWGTAIAGLLVLCLSLQRLLTTAIDQQWIVLAILAAASGFAVLRVPALPAQFSFGDAFSFAAMFLYGPAAGAVTATLDSLAMDLRLRLGPLSPARAFFNVAAPSLSMWMAGTIVFEIGRFPLPSATPNPGLALPAVAAAAALFFLLESGLLATAIGLEKRLAPRRVWKNLSSIWLDPIAGAYVGFLIAFFSRAYGITFLLLVLPIPLIVYYTFRTWLGRVDDEMRHLAEITRSYHSIVEALATAVDAKDQITHGHIQRVQIYCLTLARHLGIADERVLKALEVAALLHDVGKLGVPDRILNKPGRLTATEFDHMKQHVTVGTRILSTIDFPYPVLPIVRHHHESWDGTGYPDGVSGEMIPIGARILAVVDCFDALTSDRPYRRHMSTTEAFGILESRRATMYDPRIVDAFIRVQPQIDLPLQPTSEAIGPARFGARQDEPSTRRQQELVRLVGEALPGWLCVLYEYKAATEMVVARHALGPGAEMVRGHAVACGAGVSGWVVATGEAMDDCDGRLDLGPLVEAIGCPAGVLECTSVPVTVGGSVGAMTLYRTCADTHAKDDRLPQVLCRLIANRSAESSEAGRRR
jgi:putative nucleotidyltransferase with HDIG domain